jgi:hypothetical protein
MAFKPSYVRLTYDHGKFWIAQLTYALSTTNILWPNDTCQGLYNGFYYWFAYFGVSYLFGSRPTCARNRGV